MLSVEFTRNVNIKLKVIQKKKRKSHVVTP